MIKGVERWVCYSIFNNGCTWKDLVVMWAVFLGHTTHYHKFWYWSDIQGMRLIHNTLMNPWQKPPETKNFIAEESPFSAEQNGQIHFCIGYFVYEIHGIKCMCVQKLLQWLFANNACIKIINISLKGLINSMDWQGKLWLL